MSGEPVLIVGVGRMRHGDDAVGILTARLAVRRLRGLAAGLCDLGGWNMLNALEGRRLAIIVDAARADARLPAGRWTRIRYTASPKALAGCRLRDTHTAGVEPMLRLAGSLGRLPPAVWIYAIAGERFVPEERLSPPVRASVLQVGAQIEADVRAWAASALCG
jgi:hydrogenase maturation protease